MRNTLILILFACGTVKAQTVNPDTSYWKKGGVYSLSVTQVALQNWAAGGQSSVAANTLINLFANYKRERATFDVTLDMGYGIINQGKLPWWEKSDDKLDFSAKYGYQAFDHVYYTSLLNFKTQFSPGYDKVNVPMGERKIISDFLAPAYIILALGLDYKPNDNFNFLFAPVTGKLTIVNNQTLADAGAFGVEPGSNIRTEFGGYIKMIYKKDFNKNLNFSTKLELFSNYLNNPQNIDVNWETLLSAKVSEYVSVTLNTILIYDHDINIARDPDENGVFQKNGPTTQFKEVFALGFNYKF